MLRQKDRVTMPYREQAILEQWVTEFRSLHERSHLVKVVPQDGSDGADTGLIVFPVGNGTTTGYIEPIAMGDMRWRIHFEPREGEAVMSSADVHILAAELEMAALLCDFIETKSTQHLAALANA